MVVYEKTELLTGHPHVSPLIFSTWLAQSLTSATPSDLLCASRELTFYAYPAAITVRSEPQQGWIQACHLFRRPSPFFMPTSILAQPYLTSTQWYVFTCLSIPCWHMMRGI